MPLQRYAAFACQPPKALRCHVALTLDGTSGDKNIRIGAEVKQLRTFDVISRMDPGSIVVESRDGGVDAPVSQGLLRARDRAQVPY